MINLLLRHLMGKPFNDAVAAVSQIYPVIDHLKVESRPDKIRYLPKSVTRAYSAVGRPTEELRLYMKGKLNSASLKKYLRICHVFVAAGHIGCATASHAGSN
jgi:hypothetical protein